MFEVALALVVFIGLLLLGVPVAYSVIAGTVVGLFAIGSLPMEALAQQSFAGATDYSMLAIPFFILTADLLFSGKLGAQVIGLATRLVGRFRGGVGMTSVLTNAVFAGVSGSAVADATGLGKVMIPWTKKLGYPAQYAAAVNASSSVLGVIIPPSIPMILFSAASGASVAAIFNAGLLPGIVMAVFLMFACWFIAWRHRYPQVKAKLTMKRLLIDLLVATPAILIPVILIRVFLFTGTATVTEVSVLAAVYAILIRVTMYRDLNWKSFMRSVAESAASTAVVMVLIMFSAALSWLLTIQEAPQKLATTLLGTTDNHHLIVLFIVVILIITGMFLDMAPAILLLTPVLMPLADAIGMGTIHLGILMVCTLAMGLYTPPVGTTLYISAGIGRVGITKVTRELLLFYALILVFVLVIAYAPQLMLIPL
ncbi:TRAP transporter large permease subunit [Schaalia sp. 19OD2882]|uniref:TRAP transporter large permease n=1 Tax=Schaalia sp. 19OD2882 TaxID=2794089 RepID=UPI001C1E9FDB|nr:TRAP transporter large permease subunit [Schaalia sp. 19OD2882]QWW18708.1 TRAP transporter large permease subunit [Schaalia sp. 19OD2882]